MRIKVVCDGSKTTITNADTGERIPGVTAVEFVHASVGEVPRLKLEFIDFDLEGVAEAVEAIRSMPTVDVTTLHSTYLEKRAASPYRA